MSDTTDDDGGAPSGGSYDLLRRRLVTTARELGDAAAAIDERRTATFGASRLALLGSDRLQTEVACRARDLVRVGDVLVLGYNVSLDLAAITPEHVFSLYRRGDENGGVPTLTPLTEDDPGNFLADPAFREEFDKLYRFFGKARFVDMRVAGGQLLAAFQIGDRVDDLSVLRWSVDPSGAVSFVDGRGDRDYSWPDAQDFAWVACTREDQIAGAHPVVQVDGELFVGFRGGRLQLRVDDGRPEGRIEIDEAVEVPGQSLADVGVSYAPLGEVLLVKVALYNEPERCYIMGRRSREVTRVDAVRTACRVLPGDDGVVFPGGYHLATTGTRLFDVEADSMVFEEAVVAPNGEDVMYVFHSRETSDYLLAPYNLVRKEIAQVIPCHGFASFGDGATVLFRAAPHDAEPSTVHPVQWWDTPFADPDAEPVAAPDGDPWAQRIGNADLVGGLADAYDVARLVEEAEPSERTWEAIIAAARRALDVHLWFADDEAAPVRDGLRSVVQTAGQIVDEYAKVRRQREEAAAAVEEAERSGRRVVDAAAQAASPTDVVSSLGELRRARGEAALLLDVPQVDEERVSASLTELDEAIASLAERASTVLDSEAAFAQFSSRLGELVGEGERAATSAEVGEIAERLSEVTNDLDAVVDAVSALDGGDPTARTRIVRRVADVSAEANRARAVLEGHSRRLRDAESAEAFDAELALIEQTLSGAVVAATTPEDCDAELARLLVNAERIDARYADDPERLARVAELRDRINETFGARRSELVDERSRRARRVSEAAERLLVTITRRAAEAGDEAGIAGFFAADQMVTRVRGLADDLDELGETGQAAEVRGALAAAAEEARRRVRDTSQLMADDGSIAFGSSRFAPNAQPFELVLTPASGGGVEVGVTGTDFRTDVTDRLADHADLLDRSYPSETADIYRGEYLAWAVVQAAGADGLGELVSAAAVPSDIAQRCRAVAEHRHGEGYEVGVHDHDAARILAAVLPRGASDPVLQHAGRARALGRVLVAGLSGVEREQLTARARAARAARERVGSVASVERLRDELAGLVGERLAAVAGERDAVRVAAFLVEELGVDADSVAAASTASDLVGRLNDRLGEGGRGDLAAALAAPTMPAGRFQVALDWVGGSVEADAGLAELSFDVDEAAALLAVPEVPVRAIRHPGTVTVDGLVGEHSRLDAGTLRVRLDELADRVGGALDDMSQRWPAYTAARRAVVEEIREVVDLDEHRPKVMAGFVRNRLIDRALLPLVGTNLARQIGTVDSTDLARSGLLVLTSPPGYGKTTLMSWIADRLGMLMVKVNGPALGTATTSLDPADAPNVPETAEVEKVNLALRMGRNVVLFIDDIQFTSPDLLSRFIPLADATRRIEGVVEGDSHTFDLRGRRFAVVMAGNPYSTGGARFELPDMLVNRADVHNLGDVADEYAEEFGLSYVENSLTATPVLAEHAARLLDDVEALVAMADGRRAATTDGLVHRWSGAELDESVRTLRLVRRAQAVLMDVNEAYVRSAAMSDEDRVAPPFLLQGSYRNMARIAAQVVPAMTDDELDTVVDEHYASEAQTLTDRAEQNLLALGAMQDTLDDDERARWDAICARWSARTDADPSGRLVDALDRIAGALRDTY
ncbi:MAG: DNA repair ATPase [Actinomycetota bacterium]